MVNDCGFWRDEYWLHVVALEISPALELVGLRAAQVVAPVLGLLDGRAPLVGQLAVLQVVGEVAVPVILNVDIDLAVQYVVVQAACVHEPQLQVVARPQRPQPRRVVQGAQEGGGQDELLAGIVRDAPALVLGEAAELKAQARLVTEEALDEANVRVPVHEGFEDDPRALARVANVPHSHADRVPQRLVLYVQERRATEAEAGALHQRPAHFALRGVKLRPSPSIGALPGPARGVDVRAHRPRDLQYLPVRRVLRSLHKEHPLGAAVDQGPAFTNIHEAVNYCAMDGLGEARR
mmetsp:Transcript_63086/g.184451  ORF Transcript_63086/g.184451 Transcript_63086/m.184451 type:complete len:293 (-) Transcript_63086:23-901(-)